VLRTSYGSRTATLSERDGLLEICRHDKNCSLPNLDNPLFWHCIGHIPKTNHLAEDYVFTYRGNPVGKLHNSAWKRAWRAAGLPVESGILRGVHNLRHTFGRRLRGAGVPLETRKALLGHASGDITTHYSAAELGDLLAAAEKIVNRGLTQAPTLTVIRRKQETVGKSSEIKKGSAAKMR
jgi:integrase